MRSSTSGTPTSGRPSRGSSSTRSKDRPLVSACAGANARFEADEAIELLPASIDRVCAALNGLDWKKVLDVTDDFVVYATDYESPLRDHFKAVLPAERYRGLERRGLLPD
jgi:hypothetical protein